MDHSAKWVYLMAGQDYVGLEDVAKALPALGIAVNKDSAGWMLYLAPLQPWEFTQVLYMSKDALWKSWTAQLIWGMEQTFQIHRLRSGKTKTYSTCHDRTGCVEATKTKLLWR